MIIIGYYFDNNGGWIEYESDGVLIKKDFTSGAQVEEFIIDNGLNITYKKCPSC